MGGGFQTGGLPDLDDLSGNCAGIFPIGPFPLPWLVNSTYEEQSRKGPRHNPDLSQKRWETSPVWKPRVYFLSKQGFCKLHQEVHPNVRPNLYHTILFVVDFFCPQLEQQYSFNSFVYKIQLQQPTDTFQRNLCLQHVFQTAAWIQQPVSQTPLAFQSRSFQLRILQTEALTRTSRSNP